MAILARCWICRWLIRYPPLVNLFLQVVVGSHGEKLPRTLYQAVGLDGRRIRDLCTTVHSLHIQFGGLSSQVLMVLEVLVQQRKSIQQLQDECAALRSQIEELRLTPPHGLPPLSEFGILETAMSPVQQPPYLDLNAPAPGSS